MSLLQLRHSFFLNSIPSSPLTWGNRVQNDRQASVHCNRRSERWKRGRIHAVFDALFSKRMNLNEYIVTLEKPIGIREMQRVQNLSWWVTSKKVSASADGGFVEIKDLGDMKKPLDEKYGTFNLKLERPFSPFPVHQFYLKSDYHILFNKGREPLTSWNYKIFSSDGKPSSNGNQHLALSFFLQSSSIQKDGQFSQITKLTPLMWNLGVKQICFPNT